MIQKYLLAMCSLLLVSSSLFASQISEQTVQIPMQVKGFWGTKEVTLEATEFKPEGTGPFPLLLINHGSPRNPADRINLSGRYPAQSRAMANEGFVVLNPVRRGYGKSTGPWAENYFSCSSPAYKEAGLETAKDIEAAIEYAKSKPYIDVSRIVLVGQSAGGFGVLALASQNLPGVIGVVNFAGGRGSQNADTVCNPERLYQTFAEFAATTKVPMLWFYAQNDHYFGPAIASRLHQAYKEKSVDVTFITPAPFGDDGHTFFSNGKNVEGWKTDVMLFIQKIGALR